MFFSQALYRVLASCRSLRNSRKGLARSRKFVPQSLGAFLEPLEGRCMLSADLTGAIGAAAVLPGSVISGSATQITLPVVVHNSGDTAVPAGSLISIAIVARPEGTSGASDTLIKTLVSRPVGSLAAGSSRTFSTTLKMPAGMAAGEYNLVAEIEAPNAVGESDGGNNDAVSSPFAVVAGTVDLSAVLGSTWTLKSSVIGGKRLSGSTSVVVTNLGNLPLAVGQKVSIQLFAVDTTSPAKAPIPLLTTPSIQSVSGLRAGGSATFRPSVNLPGGLPADDYEIVATVTPVQALTEVSTANNTATLTALGATRAVHVIPPTVDLAGNIGATWTLPSAVNAGAPIKGTISIVVRNLGNVALPAVQQIYIPVVAHDTTNPGNPDILLNAMPLQVFSVGGLAAGGSKTVSVNLNWAGGLAADSYQIVATIAPVQALTQLGTGNDVVALTARGLTKTVVSTQADLAGAFGTTWTLPGTLAATKALSGYASVVVKNQGTLALPSLQKVTVTLYARDPADLDGPGILLGTFTNLSVSLLRAGGSATFSLHVSVPVGTLPADNYQIVATITPTPALSESNTANNTVLTNALGNTKLITIT
jgi:hypothetical protein